MKGCLVTFLFFPTQHNLSAELCGRAGSREPFTLPNSLPSDLCSISVALDLKSCCTRETRHPLIGHSLEQRPLCLHSTGYKHSSWEKLKSLFKGWLLKFSTLHEKSLVYQNNPLILWRQKSCLLRSHTIYYFPLYSAHVCYQ